jgi:hypothetical protein
MRALMWLGLISATVVSLLIACVPGPAPALSQAEMHPWPPTAHRPLKLCDEQGICCYSMYASGTISCVATRIIVIVSPGEISERRYSREPETFIPSEGGPETGGEVQSRTLDSRFLIQSGESGN